jgi:hypothetical protein
MMVCRGSLLFDRLATIVQIDPGHVQLSDIESR